MAQRWTCAVVSRASSIWEKCTGVDALGVVARDAEAQKRLQLIHSERRQCGGPLCSGVRALVLWQPERLP